MVLYIYRKIVGLRNLILRSGASTVQTINIIIGIGFFLAFAFNSKEILSLPLYASFKDTNIWMYMGLISLIEALLFFNPKYRNDVISGFLLMLSAPMWAIVAMNFADKQVFNTAVITYSVIAFYCAMTGWGMLDNYDEINYKCNKKTQ